MSDTDSKVTVKTNRNWRNFVYRSDVPSKILESQFSHLDADEYDDGFFQYRNYWYHISDFMSCTGKNSPFKNWHGYLSDSYFSGVVIKYSDDCEQYQIGTYFS